MNELVDFIKERITVEDLKTVARKLNYVIFNKGNYNLNIWGVRSNNPDTKHFNDAIIVFYKANDNNPKMNGKWCLDVFSATTDPSDMNLIKPINSKGCAILAEGQYLSSFAVGLHKGYKALVQYKALPLYRDNNKDVKIDIDDTLIIEKAGINIHRASKWKISNVIGLYSAGCQVFESVRDYEDKFMPLVELAVRDYGKIFSYTLINANDLIEALYE